MISLFNKQPAGAKTTFYISGMHCTSCSLTIDSELEETAGVIQSDTSYAQAKTTVSYDPTKITPDQLQKIIESLDYSVTRTE